MFEKMSLPQRCSSFVNMFKSVMSFAPYQTVHAEQGDGITLSCYLDRLVNLPVNTTTKT